MTPPPPAPDGTEPTPPPHPLPVAVVVGNPKPRSRTLGVATAVAERAAALAAPGVPVDLRVVDLAELGPELFDWSSAAVAGQVAAVSSSVLAVVASPTFKASYTGLLKAFLDRFPTTGLAGVATVPVMVGAGPAHALAVEVHLRPVLVEVGATLPTRGLYVLEGELADLGGALDRWAEVAGPALRAQVGDGPGPGA